MAYGIEIRDASGNITLSLTDRLFRFLGPPLIVASGGSGSLVNDGFLTGTPFWVSNIYDNTSTLWPGLAWLPPSVSIFGNVFSYSVDPSLPTQIIQYGVY